MLPRTCPACKHRSLIYSQTEVYCTNCPIYRKPLSMFQKPFVWASKKQGWWRVPILLWFGVMLVQNWHNPWFAINRLANPFSALDLGIHELGHMLFEPFGEFMHIAGGCLFQCLFPLLWMIGFLQKRWYFAASMCWCWLGLNLFDVAAYAADARARLLPLTTGLAGLGDQGSDEAYDKAHDWYQLLSRTHHLNWDLAIGHMLRVAATMSTFIGLTMGVVLVFYMFSSAAHRAFLQHDTSANN